MNEVGIPGKDGCAMREDVQRAVRTGCDQWDDPGIYYYTQQRFDEYIWGGAASSLKSRDYKDATDLVVSISNAETRPRRKYIVRRLTPIEAARLQGFPDWWVEGLGGSDSAIYKAYGNGLALPCAFDVLSRIVELEQEKLAE